MGAGLPIASLAHCPIGPFPIDCLSMSESIGNSGTGMKLHTKILLGLTVGLIAGVTTNLTVGVDDTGHDVQFFGATAGAHFLWDESADTLKLVGGAKIDAQDTVTVGVDDTGYDVKFFGATTGKYMLWDESADTLAVVGTAITLNGTAVGTGDARL